ncbi:MAG: hypothetical protein IJ906_12420, partial [Oscillospiraceae bacterium]|nr:hypothetical protein [Oscillospiraceae bacterium]
DITDLSSYTISVTDQALNYTSVESEAAETSVKPGVYRNDRYLYSFTDSKVRRADLMNGEITELENPVKDGKASIMQISDGKIRFVPAEGNPEEAQEDAHRSTVHRQPGRYCHDAADDRGQRSL